MIYYKNPQEYFLNNIFTRVEKGEIDGEDAIIFENVNGDSIALAHNRDCCESVYIEDICGDLNDLRNTPILVAEERCSHENPINKKYDKSFKWTFYTFRTIKGTVDIRFYGTSNGYYSEAVHIFFKKKSYEWEPLFYVNLGSDIKFTKDYFPED